MLDEAVTNFFLNHPIFKTETPELFLISSFFLCLGRLFPIMMMAPFFGSKLVPAPIKVGFSLALSLIFFPKVFVDTSTYLQFDMYFIGLLIKELFVGFLLGYLASLPFHIAQSSGTIVDHQRGAQNLQAQDPSLQAQSSPVGLLYNYLLITVFFSIKGPFLFLDVVLDSYELLPIDQFFKPSFYQYNSIFFQECLGIIHHVVQLAAQLAAPALLTVLMTDLFLGVSNRLAPQVQVIFLGMPLKALLGLGVLFPAWEFIIKQLSKESISFILDIKRYMQLLSM
ncbi:Uncharacterized protein AB751O23_BV_00040 [Chlamydiales bacterium SCGC AB-751-O23]|jgi:type III secretion protein T|nr:Uncharacterized protein AB751O23_BV_00040 [Chlamydiales bacterium SCGC AB-751-O23]